MISGSVTRRYAKAIYELAHEEGTTDEVGRALRELAEGVEKAGPETVAEGILERDARTAIGKTLAEKLGRDTIVGKFVQLVAEHDRLACLPDIFRWFSKLEDEAAGRVQLDITAAGELAAADVEAIRNAFRGIAKREVLPRVSTDSSLLGGAIVELEGRVYDGSVKTALARLASQMAGSMNGATSAASLRDSKKRKDDADQGV